MTNKELRECPCCGGKAKLIDFYGLYMVECETCKIATDTSYIKEDVIKIWNTRTNTIPVGNGEDYEVTHNG